MACFNCPVHTKHLHRVPSGDHKGLSGAGPEYGGAGYFGLSCGTGDWVSILSAGTSATITASTYSRRRGYIVWVFE